jgi:hypothetical protein
VNSYLLALAGAGAVGLWLLSLARGSKVAALESALKKREADDQAVPQEADINILESALKTLDEQREKDAKAYRDSLPPSGH